jgi:hypothetical protein
LLLTLLFSHWIFFDWLLSFLIRYLLVSTKVFVRYEMRCIASLFLPSTYQIFLLNAVFHPICSKCTFCCPRFIL